MYHVIIVHTHIMVIWRHKTFETDNNLVHFMSLVFVCFVCTTIHFDRSFRRDDFIQKVLAVQTSII